MITDTDILISALTVHGESRGCTQQGRLAVAHVIVNRSRRRRWYGKGVDGYRDHSLAAVCLKPWQFSCWNPNDPNFALLSDLQARYRRAIEKPTCRAALKAVIDAADGHASDPTGGADHYLTARLHDSVRCPGWAQGRTDYIQIGNHRFFANVA